MSFASTLGAALLAAGTQLLVLLGPLAIAVVGLDLTSAALQRAAVRLLGWKAFLVAFGWLGTAVHELSHALFCVVFGHRVTELKLFDPRASDGSLGYVRHAYDPRNPYHQVGNLFIGIAPVLVGGAALTLAAFALLGGYGARALPEGAGQVASGGHGALELARRVLDGVVSMGAPLSGGARAGWLRVGAFCYLAIAIGGLMNMSREDAKGALPGFAAIALALVVANLAALLLRGEALTALAWRAAFFLATAHAVLFAAILVNLAAALALSLIAAIAGRWTRRGNGSIVGAKRK